MEENAPDKSGRSSEPHTYMHLMMDFGNVLDWKIIDAYHTSI